MSATELVPDRLGELAISINAEWENANSLARQSIEKYIAVGSHFLEARAMFPGDKEFGQWANEQVPEVQKRWRSSLMGVARKFAPLLGSEQLASHKVLLQLPVSTLAELVPANSETIEQVVERLQGGESITKLEARRVARVERTPDPVSDTPTGGDGSPTTGLAAPTRHQGTDTPSSASPPDDKVVLEVPPPEIRMLSMLSLPFLERLDKCDDPHLIFGLNPLVDEPIVSDDTLEVLYGTLCEACNQKQANKLTKAYEELRDEAQMAATRLDLGLVAHRELEGYYD